MAGATSTSAALIAIQQQTFSLTVCRWPEFEHKGPHDFLTRLKARSASFFALTDRSDLAAIKSAYAAGMNDCFFLDSSDEEVASKMNVIQQSLQFNKRLAQAQKLESIGELAAGIAHEINTPIQYVGDNTRFVKSACDDLMTILECCQDLVGAIDTQSDVSNAVQLLRSSMKDADIEYLTEEIPSAIQQTLEGVDRVSNIVRAMKDFAHPGASEMTLTDLSKSISNTVMVARNEWKYVAEMETEFDPDLPSVPCFPGELNQVLLNIVVNAAHAIGDALGESPEGKGKITISTHARDGLAEIRIADTGGGIEQENIDRIFAPFFTTKAAGKGTGQGLAIARSVIVEKHGGTIHAESEIGSGTTFVIRIPLENDGSNPSTTPKEQLATAN